MHDIVALPPEAIPAAGRALAEALFEDALAVHVIPDREERRAKLPRQFTAVVRYGLLFGTVLTNGGVPKGVAVWHQPGHETTREQIAASGMDAASTVLGEAAMGRLGSVIDPIREFRRQDLPTPHWYLAVLGVRPGQQGRGLGAALMAPILSRADADGVACYLETAQAGNVAFYQRRGFVTVRQGVVGDGVSYWTMRRDPVTKRGGP